MIGGLGCVSCTGYMYANIGEARITEDFNNVIN